MAFPGGKIDPQDESPVAAALREAKEEVGLAPALIEPLGYLDLYLTFSGFRILPTVARVKPDFSLTLNPCEVDRDIRSAARVSDDAGKSAAPEPRLEGHQREYYAIPFGDRYIWGITAGIVRNLYDRVYAMIRPVATEIGLFLTPFVVYAAFLLRRAPACSIRRHGRCARLAGLVIVSLILMVGSFLVLAQFGGAPPGSTYVPAHIEDGKFVPQNDAVTLAPHLADAAWLKAGARSRACSRCSTATARKRAWSAARCATRCCGIPVGEIDVATTAVPEEVMRRVEAAGGKAVPTGIEHGTVTAIIDGHPFEVTTLREDVETFGRKARVVFGRDWKADAERRDFTINALSAAADGMVHDYVGGLADIARAPRALHRRAAAADRGRLSAHPALFPLSRAFRRRRARSPPACTPASPRAPASRRLSRERVRMETAEASGRSARDADARGDGGERAPRHGARRRRLSRELREHDQSRGGASAPQPDAVRRLGALGVWVKEDAGAADATAAAGQCRIRAARCAGPLVARYAGRGGTARARAALQARAANLHRPRSYRLVALGGRRGRRKLARTRKLCRNVGPRRCFRSRPRISCGAALPRGRRWALLCAPPKLAWIEADFPSDRGALEAIAERAARETALSGPSSPAK